MTFDEEKFNQLLATKDFDSARGLIGDFFNQEITKKEKGGVLAEAALAYIRLVNKLNEGYISFLEDMTAEIKNLDNFKKEVGEKFDIAAVESRVKSAAT